jgi:hypothetical protein
VPLRRTRQAQGRRKLEVRRNHHRQVMRAGRHNHLRLPSALVRQVVPNWVLPLRRPLVALVQAETLRVRTPRASSWKARWGQPRRATVPSARVPRVRGQNLAGRHRNQPVVERVVKPEMAQGVVRQRTCRRELRPWSHRGD